MIFGPKDPGSWQGYLNANKNLPLHEVTRRYLLEQAEFESFLRQQMLNANQGKGSTPNNTQPSSPSPTPAGNFLLTENGDTITDERGNPIITE